jgi:hypothetical protein
MSMDKFKYILNPDNVYIIVFDGYRGEPVKAEIKGSEIIAKLRREYLLEDLMLSEERDEREDTGK